MRSNMNIVVVWAWMLWSSDAIEHERSHGLGMDALAIGCTRTYAFLWFGHGCSGHRMRSNMNVIMVRAWMLWPSDASNIKVLMVWAWMLWPSDASNIRVIMVWSWMLWSSDAIKHERYYGSGMDAWVLGFSRT